MTLTDRQKAVLELIPATRGDIAESLDITPSTVSDHISGLRADGYDIASVNGLYRLDYEPEPQDEPEPETQNDLSSVELGDEPNPDDLTDRERVLVSELQ